MAGRFLQIGVPVNGFDQFVKVTRDFSCNMTTVTGYCVDIFDAVVEALPYAMTCQYITFAKPDGKFAGSYSDLVYQVYFKVKLIFSHLFSIHRNTMLLLVGGATGGGFETLRGDKTHCFISINPKLTITQNSQYTPSLSL